MTRASRFSTIGLLARHAQVGVTASLLVGMLVAIAVFGVALAPRALARLTTEELRHAASELAPTVRDLRGAGAIGVPYGLAGTPSDRLLAPTDAALRLFRDDLPQPLRDLTGPADWMVRTASRDAALPATAEPVTFVARIAIDPLWQKRVTFVSGEAPTAWTGDESDRIDDPPLEVGLSTRTSAELGLGVGESVAFGPLTLVVTGLYEAVDPADAAWSYVPDVLEPIVDNEPGQPPTVRASVLTDPGSLGGLVPSMTVGPLVAWVPIDGDGLEAADAPLVVDQLRNALAADVPLPYAGTITFSSLLTTTIEDALGRATAVGALMALAVSGLFGVVLAVLALSITTMVDRRRHTITLASSRGASGTQVRAALALEGLAIAAPATVLGLAAAAALVPEPIGIEAWILPLAVGLCVPALFALLSRTNSGAGPRRDLRVRVRAGGRLTAELIVCGLAVASILLLARRGLEESAVSVGIDPLLVLAPLLVTAAVCLIVLRVYPAPLLAVLAQARRGGGGVSLLGAARAVRAPVFGFAASFALVLGISVVIFSTIFGATLRDGVEAGVRDRIGADIRVSAPSIRAEVVADVRELPSVAGAAALSTIGGVGVQSVLGNARVTLLATDMEALRTVRPDIPDIDPDRPGAVGLLVSSDLRDRIGADARIGQAPVEVVGELAITALPGPLRSWALIDESLVSDLGREVPEPDQLLVAVSAGADYAATTAAVDAVVVRGQPEELRGAVVTASAQERLDAVRASPLTRGIEALLPVAATGALLLTLLGIALATVGAAASRNQTVAVLGILGASTRQQRGVLLWEFVPPVLVSIATGAAVGFMLPLVVTSIVDLRAFVGGRVPPDPVIDPVALLVAVASIVGVAVATGAVALVVARRLTPAVTLRMGER